MDSFEWDEAKRRSNIAKHGIDFLRARSLFDGRLVLTRPSPRGGEDRFLTVGNLDGKIVTVIWTDRGCRTVRIISARRARHEEEKDYRQLYN